MSPPDISGCGKYLPEAKTTFYKFYVIKEVNKTMDELRKLERKGNDMLKNHKLTFFKNKLTTKIKQEKDLLMVMYPKLWKATN
jgi:hypothetical protein